MQNVLLTIHVLVCLVLTVLVLLQHGKGADQGLLSGSNSASLFGSSGSASFLVKLTTVIAFVFFASSIFLGYYQSRVAYQITNEVAATQPVNQGV